jgi:hypothetical protein
MAASPSTRHSPHASHEVLYWAKKLTVFLSSGATRKYLLLRNYMYTIFSGFVETEDNTLQF